MTLRFSKYHGCGNDFILLDARSVDPGLTAASVAQLCHRRFGIGADGLILLTDDPAYDFRMRYFNADGNEGSMCGNGGRCLVQFAKDQGIDKSIYHFIATDGPHDAEILNTGLIKLKMQDVKGMKESKEAKILNTGSPHYIQYVEHVDQTDVFQIGRSIRYHETFKADGINVNFVEHKNGKLNVRTYERGVEDETLSCGTGVTASALAAAASGIINGKSECSISVPGGNLKVKYKTEDRKSVV